MSQQKLPPGHRVLEDAASEQELWQIKPYLRHCGNARRKAWVMESRCLLDYLLVYIAEGRGKFSIGEEEWEAEAGDLFWIPPATPHRMEGYPPSMVCPYVHFDLLYDPARSHWDFTIPPGTHDLSAHREKMHPPVQGILGGIQGKLESYTNHTVGKLIDEICTEAARSQPYCHTRLSGLLLEIIALVLRGRTSAGNSRHSIMLEKAQSIMAAHCEEEISVEVLARECNLSPAHFRHLFQQYFGRPPREHIRHLRIHKAKQLIVAGELNFTQIASRCGFSTVHSFSRAFKACEGMSPTQYKTFGPASIRVDLRSGSGSGARTGSFR